MAETVPAALPIKRYFDAVSVYRVSHFLHRWRIPLLPRLFEWVGVILFKSLIPRTATIGAGTHCAHRGVSVAVHPRATIGARVFIGIHALVGSRAPDAPPPVIEDDVFLGMNSIVLCERVGRGALIGVGAVVLDDVPPLAVMVGSPARQIGTLKRPWSEGAIEYADRDSPTRAKPSPRHDGNGQAAPPATGMDTDFGEIKDLDFNSKPFKGYFNAVSIHRASSFLYRRRIPLLPRVVEEIGFVIFNSFVPKTATVGPHTHCAHRGVGVGVHGSAQLGARVFIGIHVLVGGRTPDFGPPVIEDDVFLGMNSVILCGRVGRGAMIGVGAVVVDDVPPLAVMVGNPARQIGTLQGPWWQGVKYAEKRSEPKEAEARP